MFTSFFFSIHCRTALHMAALYSRVVIVQRLVEAGAVMVEDNEGKTPLDNAEGDDDDAEAVSSYLRCKCT